jgi:hypothetical protein
MNAHGNSDEKLFTGPTRFWIARGCAGPGDFKCVACDRQRQTIIIFDYIGAWSTGGSFEISRLTDHQKRVIREYITQGHGDWFFGHMNDLFENGHLDFRKIREDFHTAYGRDVISLDEDKAPTIFMDFKTEHCG